MKHNQEKPHHYPIKPKKMKSENISFGAIKTGIFLLLMGIREVITGKKSNSSATSLIRCIKNGKVTIIPTDPVI